MGSYPRSQGQWFAGNSSVCGNNAVCGRVRPVLSATPLPLWTLECTSSSRLCATHCSWGVSLHIEGCAFPFVMLPSHTKKRWDWPVIRLLLTPGLLWQVTFTVSAALSIRRKPTRAEVGSERATNIESNVGPHLHELTSFPLPLPPPCICIASTRLRVYRPLFLQSLVSQPRLAESDHRFLSNLYARCSQFLPNIPTLTHRPHSDILTLSETSLPVSRNTQTRTSHSTPPGLQVCHFST